MIEDAVTRNDRFEFYMIPHSSSVGLQCPVRYEVIQNTFKKLEPKDLYDLTNILCYGYYNLQGVVKLPAPLMYAITLCNQAIKIYRNESEEIEIADVLKDKLFYI